MQATAVARFWPKIDSMIDGYVPISARATGIAQIPFSQKISSWIAEYRRGGVRGNRVLKMPYREPEHITTPWKWLQHHGKVEMGKKPEVYQPPLWWDFDEDAYSVPPNEACQTKESEYASVPPKKRQRELPASPDININIHEVGTSSSKGTNISGSNVTVNNFGNFSQPKHKIGMTEIFDDSDESDEDNAYAYLGSKPKGGLPSKKAMGKAKPRSPASQVAGPSKKKRKVVPSDSSDESDAHMEKQPKKGHPVVATPVQKKGGGTKDKKQSDTTTDKPTKTAMDKPTEKANTNKKGTNTDKQKPAKSKAALMREMKLLKTTMLKDNTTLYIPASFFKDYKAPAVGYWTGMIQSNVPRGRPTQIRVKVDEELPFFVEATDAVKWLERPTEKEGETAEARAPSPMMSSDPSLPSTSDLEEEDEGESSPGQQIDRHPRGNKANVINEAEVGLMHDEHSTQLSIAHACL